MTLCFVWCSWHMFVFVMQEYSLLFSVYYKCRDFVYCIDLSAVCFPLSMVLYKSMMDFPMTVDSGPSLSPASLSSYGIAYPNMSESPDLVDSPFSGHGSLSGLTRPTR